MQFEYLKEGGRLGDECWIDRTDRGSVTYKRVAASIVLPTPEQRQGCILVVGETYKQGMPPEFTALKARVAHWLDIEQGLGEFRRDYLMGMLVTEPEENENPDIRRIPGLRWGSEKAPLSIVSAPKTAVTEIARQKVDGLIEQKRLHLDAVRNVLDQAAGQGARALQCLLVYLLEHPAQYKAPYVHTRPPSTMSA